VVATVDAKASVGQQTQVVKIHTLSNRTVLEQGVVESDRGRGIQRVTNGDFDF
jgi:hypothetical protein